MAGCGCAGLEGGARAGGLWVKGLEGKGQPSGDRAHPALVCELSDHRPVGRRAHGHLLVMTAAREQCAVRREGGEVHLRTHHQRHTLTRAPSHRANPTSFPPPQHAQGGGGGGVGMAGCGCAVLGGGARADGLWVKGLQIV
eukprot:3321761-Prymnesium_polylepis.1